MLAIRATYPLHSVGVEPRLMGHRTALMECSEVCSGRKLRRPIAEGRQKLLNQPQEGSVEQGKRRRRTSRHRRNRRIRRVLLAVFGVGLVIGFAAVAIQRRSHSDESRAAELNRQAAQASQNILLLTQQESLRQMESRPVYPYSVVTGGVRDANELKWAAEHDPIVAAHYAGFDYRHARIEVLKATLSAYVSYRIGNKVYWMRHPVRLKKGETVITDGKITARSRCGNRVEEVPQQATSSSEPPAAKFEEPMHPGTGTAFVAPPAPFQSALLNRPALPGLGPAPPLTFVRSARQRRLDPDRSAAASWRLRSGKETEGQQRHGRRHGKEREGGPLRQRRRRRGGSRARHVAAGCLGVGRDLLESPPEIGPNLARRTWPARIPQHLRSRIRGHWKPLAR